MSSASKAGKRSRSQEAKKIGQANAITNPMPCAGGGKARRDISMSADEIGIDSGFY